MSMNVNTTGTVYGSYQNTYKAGTVDKKKETAKTTGRGGSRHPGGGHHCGEYTGRKRIEKVSGMGM